MKKYLLDTNAVSHFAHDLTHVREKAFQAKRLGARIGTTHAVVAELYYGLELSASRERNEQTIEAGIRQLKAWPFDLSAAKECGTQANRSTRSKNRLDDCGGGIDAHRLYCCYDRF